MHFKTDHCRRAGSVSGISRSNHRRSVIFAPERFVEYLVGARIDRSGMANITDTN
jgi:hypothetical protein